MSIEELLLQSISILGDKPVQIIAPFTAQIDHAFRGLFIQNEQPSKNLPRSNRHELNCKIIRIRIQTGRKSDYYQIGNSDLRISQDATASNTSMIAVRAEKMAVSHGSSPPSVRLSRAGLPET